MQICREAWLAVALNAMSLPKAGIGRIEMLGEDATDPRRESPSQLLISDGTFYIPSIILR